MKKIFQSKNSLKFLQDWRLPEPIRASAGIGDRTARSLLVSQHLNLCWPGRDCLSSSGRGADLWPFTSSSPPPPLPLVPPHQDFEVVSLQTFFNLILLWNLAACAIICCVMLKIAARFIMLKLKKKVNMLKYTLFSRVIILNIMQKNPILKICSDFFLIIFQESLYTLILMLFVLIYILPV